MSLIPQENLFYRNKLNINTDFANNNELSILLGVNTALEEILLTSIIRQTCHSVHIVNDGFTALKSLEEFKLDVCMFSYELPKISGPEISKIIRQSNNRYKNIPIVGLISTNNQEQIKECLIAGMNYHLLIPTTIEKSLDILKFYTTKSSNNFYQIN